MGLDHWWLLGDRQFAHHMCHLSCAYQIKTLTILRIFWPTFICGCCDIFSELKPCLYKHLEVKGVAQANKIHGQGTALKSVLDEGGT